MCGKAGLHLGLQPADKGCWREAKWAQGRGGILDDCHTNPFRLLPSGSEDKKRLPE